MSTAPRRSLRLRNGNLAEKEKEEPEVKVKTGAPKHRAAVTAASAAERENAAASKAPLKKKAKDEVKEEKGDEEMRDEEEKEEDGGSDEDMEEEKPIKNGQRSPKKNSETASAAEGTRPKRRCSLAATQAFKEMASADGPSDDEDFDIEKEIKKKRNEQKELIEQASTSVSKEKKEKVERRKKRNEQKELTENASMEIKEKKVKYAVGKVAAKKKRGKKVEMEEDTETEKEEDNEEEKSVKKETKKAGDSSSRGPKLQRPPSLDRPSEKVRLLMDKEYNVDRDEMIAWEKRSVHMARELRTLESSFEHQSGRQKEVNTRVQEFVQRCLKDRRCEMGLSEAVRQCNILQGEFDEWERKKKMTITQRIKEQVENEKKERDAEDSDESKEEEDEWEDMETVDGEGEVKTMQVHVENQKTVDNKTLWYSKWLKQEVNRAMRTRCENTHKAHLLSYVAHLRHLAAMALSPSSKDGEIPLSAIALSMIPSKGKKKKNREKEREDLIEWWRKKFEKEEDTEEEEDDRSEEMRVSERMMKRRYTNHKEAALMLFSLLAADGFTVRIVSRCKVITKKVPESAETKKKEEKKEAGKRKKKESSVEPRDYPSIDYWIEVWDEAKEQWKPISAIRTEKDEDDEDEEWGFLVEPLNSCMEKDGRVLYMLAIDNAFAIRDVSARYIHSQDFVSKEFRNRRAGHEWLNELWEMDPWRAHSIRSSKEDDEWLTSMKVEMPKTVGQYKDHPLYVLDKDVLKQQRIFPYDVPSLGEIRGYKIYSRKFVRPTHPAKWYEKMGRQVRDDEPPVGEKKLTNPMTGGTQMQGLFGYWQTTRWDAGEVVHGRVPRNEFNNIYMYQPKEMCPKGGIYIIPEGLQRVAREHGKDCVEAVIGWTYKGGNIVPVIKGAVFAKEDLPELIGAWKECEKRWKAEEKKRRSERSLAGWKKLIKGMLRLAAMRKEFEPMENRKKKGTRLGDEAVRAEEAAAWPQQRYGGDMFE